MKKYLFILCILISFVAKAQTYNPSIAGVTMNKPAGIAQAVSTDARSYFYDTVNFIWRRYQSTNEVLSYLNLPKYRTGQFSVFIDSGGALQSNGVFIGGVTQEWWFKDSTGNANLVQKFSSNSGGGGSGVTSVSATSSTGYTWSISNPTTTPNISLLLTAGGDLSGFWPDITVAKFNGQLPSYYLNYNNLFNTPFIPPQVNLIAGTNISITGSYPNLTIAANNFFKDTVFGKYPLYVPIGVPDTLAIYNVDTVGGVTGNDGYISAIQYTALVHKQNPIQVLNALVPQGAAGQNTVWNFNTNLTTTQSGDTITINASSSTALQAKVTWRNQDSTILAAAGIATSIQLDSGLYGELSGSNLKLFVRKDTLFGAYKGSPGDSLIWFGGIDTIYSPRFRDSLNFHHVFNADGSLTLYSAGGTTPLSHVYNGLTFVAADSSIQWYGQLTRNDTLIGGSFFPVFSSSATTAFKIIDSATSGTALRITSTGATSAGIILSAGSNGVIATAGIIGVSGTATGHANSIGVFGASDIGVGGYFENNTVADSNTAQSVVDIVQVSSGGRTGLGASVDYLLADSLSFLATSSKLISKWVYTTHNAASGQFQVWNNNAGTLQQQLTLLNTGQLQLNNYPGSLTTSDTTTHKPVSMDASGNLFRETYWPGGGGGGGSSALSAGKIGFGSGASTLTSDSFALYNSTTHKATFDSLTVRQLYVGSSIATTPRYVDSIVTNVSDYSGAVITNRSASGSAVTQLQVVNAGGHSIQLNQLSDAFASGASVIRSNSFGGFVIANDSSDIILEFGVAGVNPSEPIHIWYTSGAGNVTIGNTLPYTGEYKDHGVPLFVWGNEKVAGQLIVDEFAGNYALISAGNFADSAAYLHGVGIEFTGVTQANPSKQIAFWDSVGHYRLPIYTSTYTTGGYTATAMVGKDASGNIGVEQIFDTAAGTKNTGQVMLWNATPVPTSGTHLTFNSNKLAVGFGALAGWIESDSIKLYQGTLAMVDQGAHQVFYRARNFQDNANYVEGVDHQFFTINATSQNYKAFEIDSTGVLKNFGMPTSINTPTILTHGTDSSIQQISLANLAPLLVSTGSVANADLTGQTGTVASVATFTPGANGTFRVGVYTAITAISAGTLTITVTYTDETSASRTLTLFPMGITSAGLTGTGETSFPVADIRAKSGNAITVVATFAGVSITYDIGASINQLR